MKSDIRSTKSLLLLIGTSNFMLSGQAQEMGRVLSATPVFQQVSVPQQVCHNQNVMVQSQKSGGGAVMGAIAGGAMGNAVGGGSGKAAATMLGIIGGAIIGDNIEGQPGPSYQTVQRCQTQMMYANKLVNYNVTYEYAGRQYSMQMNRDPGPFVTLNIAPSQSYQQSYQQSPPVYQAPSYQSYPSYPSYPTTYSTYSSGPVTTYVPSYTPPPTYSTSSNNVGLILGLGALTAIAVSNQQSYRYEYRTPYRGHNEYRNHGPYNHGRH